MDQYPAQPTPDIPVQPVSPAKKFLPLVLIAILILLVLSGALVFSPRNSKNSQNISAPTSRPTATPFPPPTLPMVTKPAATSSATVAPVKIGRLVFIKNGDIYNSDFTTFSIFVKNATPAADRLSWSPFGNLLAWRVTSTTATPAALAIYKRDDKTTLNITPSSSSAAELMDYVWSADEKKIAVLYKDTSYNIGLFPVASSSAQTANLFERNTPIKQILWPNSKTMIFSGDDGITSLDVASLSARLLVNSNQVLKMKLSPDKNKLLYSLGTDAKNYLSIINIDGSSNQIIQEIPAKVDMGTTNQPTTILNNGFLPYALWFPKGDKLMVGYHYITNLPLVGIYDLVNNSFTALSTFALYENDFMVDDLRMSGVRVSVSGGSPSWQLSFFTIEDNAKLATVRVIPDASSPAFFGDDLLPSGNLF